MVIHKRLDYGSSGYQVPPMPQVPRSAKGKRSARKKIEVNPLSAFDLLATVAGKLLEAENTSPLPDHTTTEKDTSRQETMDKGKSPEVEVFDRRSCNRSMLVPEGSVHRQGNHSTNDHPQTSNNTVSGHSSMFIKSDKPDKDVFAGNSMVTDTRVELGHCLGMIPEKCSRDVRSPDSMESCKNKLEEIIKTPLRAEGQFSGIKTVAGNALGLYASEQAMDVDTKPPALVSSDSSVEIALCGNHTGNSSIPMCGERMEHDDDENSSGCTHPKTTTSKTIKAQCVGGRRVRKLLGSKYWKATPTILKEGDLSDTEMKPVYRGRKICYTRQRTERSSFKRRKLCEHLLLSASDGGMNREGTSNSPTKGSIKLEAIDSHEIHGVSGASSSTDQKSSYEAGDHNVKFSIKSFKVPEIFIEIPESATVGSLKKTVMEAVTAMLGSGLRVGVLQQGKKVRDDSKTLIQAGMSHDDKMENLGFTLEPNSTQTRVPPLLTTPEDFLPPYDTAKQLIRFPAVSPPPAQVAPINSLQPPLTTLVNSLESDNDSAHSPVDMSSQDKTAANSKALVPVPAMGVEALAVVPLRKSRHAELAQRRIRRPFSVAEVEALVQAVEKLGTGRWRDVKLRAFENAKHRTYVDLKDKWKTLVHTARISPQQRRGEPVPQELLDRVLAAHAYWSQQQAKLQIKSPPAEACLLF